MLDRNYLHGTLQSSGIKLVWTLRCAPTELAYLMRMAGIKIVYSCQPFRHYGTGVASGAVPCRCLASCPSPRMYCKVTVRVIHRRPAPGAIPF